MARHDDNVERRTAAARERPLVYLPCPACGSAVLLSDANRLRDEPPAYECPTCRAVFELLPPGAV